MTQSQLRLRVEQDAVMCGAQALATRSPVTR